MEKFRKLVLKLFPIVLLIGLPACSSTKSPSSQANTAQANASPLPEGLAPNWQEAAIGATTNGDYWPRIFVAGDTTFTVFQPQVEAWDGHTLTARNAVAVQSPDQPHLIYGVMTVHATTVPDKTERRVNLENVEVLRADFPGAPGKSQQYLNQLRAQFPKEFRAVSLDSLETSLAANQQQQKANVQPLNNTPPRILVATRPSVLVYVDGPPAYRPVAGTDLQRVINTRVLLLKDNHTGRLYLHVLDGYLAAPGLEGPWTVSSAPPGADVAEAQARASRDVDLLEGQPAPNTRTIPHLTAATAPSVFVATQPTELLTFNGPPAFASIPGTHLLYATNTTGNVFQMQPDQQIYVLLSGRWYRANSLQGPWQFVPGEQLPPDFAQIPDASPKENVKASVPGTTQAQEALIENSIPQSTKVSRTTPIQPPRIDGPPQLAPIPGTPLYYVVNSNTPLIKVGDQSWYACQNGIWFVATSVNGPWQVADSVPPVIYSIPPTSPLYYVTYVRIYASTPEYVYEGYTPGYLGTVVAPDNVVVYGTGYAYEPWVGSVWYGEPITWGLGCDPGWTPWFGWCYGFGFGWFWGEPHHHWAWHPPAPWWGPYRHWAHRPWGGVTAWGPGGWAHTGANLYYHPFARAGTPYRAFGVNPWRGIYGPAYNSRTGALAAGHRAQVQNVFHPPRNLALTPTGRPDFLGRNNAIAMPDGGVYLRDGHGPNSWRAVTPTAPQVIPPSTLSGLGRESAARGLGQQHFGSFQSTVPPGGFHAGGGYQGHGAGSMGGGMGHGGGGLGGFGGGMGGFGGHGGGGGMGGFGGGGGHR